MASLIVFHLRFLYSMGVGGALVALTAALVSLTVLPALLAALGPRVNALSLKRWQVAMHRDAAHVRAGPWYRFSQFVMRRPAPIATGDRGAADRARPAVPADRLHRRRRERAAARTLRARGAGRARHRVPARAHGADLRRRPVRTTPPPCGAYAQRLGRAAGRRGGVPSPRGPATSGGSTSSTGSDALSDPAKQLVRDVRADRRAVPASRSAAAPPLFMDQQASLRGLAAARARAALHDDARDPVRDDRLGRAPGEGAADEPADAERRVRPARADLPGRAAGGPARLPVRRARWSRPSRSCCSRSRSGSRPTTACSC